jgi:Ca2+-binding EF-hand superfamily protein
MENHLSVNRGSVNSGINLESYNKFESLSLVTYGITVLKLESRGEPKQKRVYLNDYNKNTLHLISIGKKLDKDQNVEISTLKKVEFKGTSKGFLNYKFPYNKDSAASLYFNKTCIELIFSSQQEMMQWMSGLYYIYNDINNINSNCVTTDKNISNQIWGLADKNNSGTLDIKEVESMFKSMNLNISSQEIKNLFNYFDTNKNNLIDKSEFDAMIANLMKRPEIHKFFEKYAEEKNYLNKIDFYIFLQDFQADYDKNRVKLFEAFSEVNGDEQIITLKRFKDYIFSPISNSVIKLEDCDEFMDMSFPLTNYFIASSHNTYLEGNQFTGVSSVAQYTKVLLEGCRCIEIDTWNGDESPVVTHGYTFVNKIPFRDVLIEVKKSAFVVSPYPVIFSIENHCNYEQTGMLADIFKEVLGDQLYINDGSLLTPEFLKHKFMVKGKTEKSKKSKKPKKPKKSKKSKKPEKFKDSEKDKSLEILENFEDPIKIKKGVNPKFVDIVSMPGSELSIPGKIGTIHSITETKIEKVLKKYGCGEFIKEHTRTFCRIYPKGTRVNSTNYNPLNYWIYGVQMAALNYQSTGIEKLINDTWFRRNGKTGYILKPSFMRDSETLFDIESADLSVPKVNFSIEVISAFNLPKVEGSSEVISPYIEISIEGIPKDRKTYSTKVVEKNGFNPIWNEYFVFEIRLIEMSLLIIKACCTASNTPICNNAILLSSLSPGIRAISLYNTNLELLPNTVLLCKVNLSPA